MLAAVTSSAAPAATNGGCNNLTRVRYSVATTVAGSQSTTFTNLSEGKISFVQGGTSPSCVIVRFSAQTFASSIDNAAVVKAVLDNTVDALPGSVQLSGDDGTKSRAHSYEFVFPSVTPGSHILRMQFKSGLSGLNAQLNNYTTILHHAP